MKVLTLLFAYAFYAISINAATIHVPSDQLTIQAGIDATVNGDTVLLTDGMYTGDGNRDNDFGSKDIVLKSENGPVFTVIDCEGNPGNAHRGSPPPKVGCASG